MNFLIFISYINTLNLIGFFKKYQVIRKFVTLTQIWSTFYVKPTLYIYIYIYIYIHVHSGSLGFRGWGIRLTYDALLAWRTIGDNVLNPELPHPGSRISHAELLFGNLYMTVDIWFYLYCPLVGLCPSMWKVYATCLETINYERQRYLILCILLGWFQC